MENILIIKTGAAGDVVRTTSLLNVLEGNIYWVTSPGSKLLLPGDMPHLRSFTLEEAPESLINIHFDLVISLEEDNSCARLAGEMKTHELAGVYINHDKVAYTDNSSAWFDMSMVSRFGLEEANKLKAANTLTYQDCIFNMIGKKFNGEPYRIYSDKKAEPHDKMVGIEKRTGERWPDKQWWGYDALTKRLGKENIPFKIFEQRNNVREKTCTAIFNCTSPQEIYDYGLLRKAVSPLLSKYFYSSGFDKEVIESIPVEDVYRTLPLSK
jgi:heptosyltransferase-2